MVGSDPKQIRIDPGHPYLAALPIELGLSDEAVDRLFLKGVHDLISRFAVPRLRNIGFGDVQLVCSKIPLCDLPFASRLLEKTRHPPEHTGERSKKNRQGDTHFVCHPTSAVGSVSLAIRWLLFSGMVGASQIANKRNAHRDLGRVPEQAAPVRNQRHGEFLVMRRIESACRSPRLCIKRRHGECEITAMQKVSRAEILALVLAVSFFIGTAILPFIFPRSGGLPPCNGPAFGIPCAPAQD